MMFVMVSVAAISISFFFFNDTATTEIYTLSLHDALPIRHRFVRRVPHRERRRHSGAVHGGPDPLPDRKSTRLNSSHMSISYAVFCLKKKKIQVEGPKRAQKKIKT